MSVLRHFASAAGGAALAGCVFSLMGQATAPAMLEPGWAPRAEPRPSQVALSLCDKVAPAYPWASDLMPMPATAVRLGPDYSAEAPGFDLQTQIDPAAIELELVVLSRRLSMAEPEVKRRWWRSVLSELLED